MFFLPIGHESHNIRRLPWVTLSIALICTLLRVQACSVEDAAVDNASQTAVRLNSLLRSVATSCLRKDDCPLDEDSSGKEIAELLRTRQIGDSVEQELFASLDSGFTDQLAHLPARRLGYQPASFNVLKLFTYMFAHGSLMHLVGNMLFLYLVGLTIEERWGRLRFLIFYLAGGVVSALAYGAVHAGSEIPLVGASGAIAAAMGAFVVLYARTKVKFFYFFWFLILKTGTFRVPAWVVLPLWFLEQLLSVSGEVSGEDHVGYSAHIGGFAFGVIVAVIIRVAGFDRRFKYENDVASGDRAEDPLFLDAQTLAARGDERAALLKVEQVLAKHPQHAGALQLGYECALKTRNYPQLEKYAAHMFPQWSRSASARVLEGYRVLAAPQRKDQKIDENLLDHALTAATTLSDLTVAQDVMRRIFLQDRSSIRIPKSLWSIGQIYETHGQSELAAQLFERLRQEYPASPWAEKAKLKMGN